MDFELIKNEYLSSDTTYKALSDKYGVSVGAIRYKAQRERWQDEKKKGRAFGSEAENGFVEERIKSVAQKLLCRVEQAAEQLDRHIVKNKVKTKTVTYYDESGKTATEIIAEDEIIGEAVSIIDKNELKQLVTTLKDIKEIHEAGNSSNDSGEIENLIKGLIDE